MSHFTFIDIPLDTMQVRLIGHGTGLVQLQYGTTWSYVCADDQWRQEREAIVVCNQLGYNGEDIYEWRDILLVTQF